MITRENVRKGLHTGKIKLATDPNMGQGAVCFIGDMWFYFGGLTAESMSPEQYKEEVPEDDIIREIYDTLESFRQTEEFKDEYGYYNAILAEEGQ